MPPEVTTHDLEQLGDKRFEQLIASLVFADHPEARRPAVPDGGADVIFPAKDGQPSKVWQVKLYPRTINWTKCVKSLDDAVKNHQPDLVTFVFPKDLTSKTEQPKFAEKLDGRHKGVTVDRWELFHIQERLAANPQIWRRYFGDETEEVLARALEQGNKPLNTINDLTDRAFALGEFADGLDPNFDYVTSFGPAEAAPRIYTDVPFMTVTRTRGDRAVTHDAFLRDEATSEARFGFDDSEEGQQAREKVRLSFAAGEPVELTGGIWLRVDPAPVAAKKTQEEFLEAGIQQASVTLTPGPARKLAVRVERDGQVFSRQFAVRAIPFAPGANAALGGSIPGLFLTMDFRLPGPPKVQVRANLGYWRTEDATTNAASAQFILDFFAADRTVFIADGFLPDGGLEVDRASKMQVSEQTLEQLGVMAEFFAAVAVIEAEHGPLPIPGSITNVDLARVVLVAEIIKTRRGIASADDLVLDVPFNEVDATMDSFRRGRSVRLRQQMTVLDTVVDLGIAEFKMPKARMVATERGIKPGFVRLRPKQTGESIEFRLIRENESPVVSDLLWTPARGELTDHHRDLGDIDGPGAHNRR
jgi:hypothetical protein